jgi:hypothetical protein
MRTFLRIFGDLPDYDDYDTDTVVELCKYDSWGVLKNRSEPNAINKT